MDETGIEWDAGEVFAPKQASKQSATPNLIDGAEPTSESAVGRFLSRWRNRQQSNDKSKSNEMSPDDLAWLESIGGPSAIKEELDRQATAGGGRGSGAEEDWLAFVQNSSPTSAVSSLPQSSSGSGLASRLQLKTSVPSATATPPQLAPPPKFDTHARPSQLPSQGASHLPLQNLSAKSASSAKPSSATMTMSTPYHAAKHRTRMDGSYRDDVADFDDSLLSTSSAGTPGKSSSSSRDGYGGMPRRYLYDENEEDDAREEDDDSWSAFKDAPSYRDEPQQSQLPARESHPVTSSLSSPPTSRPSSFTTSPMFAKVSAGNGGASMTRSTGSTTSLSQSGSQGQNMAPLSRSSTPGGGAGGGAILGPSQKGGMLPPPPPSTRHLPGPQISHVQASGSASAPLSRATSQTSGPAPTASAAGSTQQRPPTTTAPPPPPPPSALSKGSTLTKDDLSFFESF